jgi:hypothetical protein
MKEPCPQKKKKKLPTVFLQRILATVDECQNFPSVFEDVAN